MDTNSASASGTCPPYLFIFHKFQNTELPYIFKVLDHTHVVFCTVSFVQVFQSVTGKIPAFKTKTSIFFMKNSTVLDPAITASDRFFVIRSPAARTSVSFPQTCNTGTAIHSTWSYQQNLSSGFHRNSPYFSLMLESKAELFNICLIERIKRKEGKNRLIPATSFICNQTQVKIGGVVGATCIRLFPPACILSGDIDYGKHKICQSCNR